MYSAALDLSAVRILVVGGGKVATRKLKGLPKGSVVTLVSPSFLASARAQARRLDVSIRRRPFRSSDTRGQRLVFACTNAPETNASIAKAARRAGAWVCVADEPGLGDFQIPAVGRAGRLIFTLSTGGSSPALAKALRQELERRLRASSVNWILGQLGKRRAWLKANPRAKAAVVKALQRPAFMRLLLDPSSATRRRALSKALSLSELAHA